MSSALHPTHDPVGSEIATVRRRKVRYRTAIVAAIVIAGFSLSLSACSTIGTAACTKSSGALIKSSGSTLYKGSSSTTLPPSHDNDAGRGRIPDRTPDADIDANQRPHLCKGPK
jgi:hypothetical protein